MTKTADQRARRNEAFQLLKVAERLLRDAGLGAIADELGPVMWQIQSDAQSGLAGARADAMRRLAGGK